MGREFGEVRTGDLIEFADQPESSGVITNMMGEGEEVFEVVLRHEQRRVKAMVIHQASDGKFAVWQTCNLPRFNITFRRRAN